MENTRDTYVNTKEGQLAWKEEEGVLKCKWTTTNDLAQILTQGGEISPFAVCIVTMRWKEIIKKKRTQLEVVNFHAAVVHGAKNCND